MPGVEREMAKVSRPLDCRDACTLAWIGVPAERPKPACYTIQMVTWVLALILFAFGCGESAPEQPLLYQDGRVPRSFKAGDLDPYGCPYVDPVPWESTSVHQEACGPGCEPDGTRECGGEIRFVGCVADSVPRWPSGWAVSAMVVTMVHPINGKQYCFSSPATALPFGYLCWSLGERDGILLYPSDAPDECFED